jgi:hypothetical protein
MIMNHTLVLFEGFQSPSHNLDRTTALIRAPIIDQNDANQKRALRVDVEVQVPKRLRMHDFFQRYCSNNLDSKDNR